MRSLKFSMFQWRSETPHVVSYNGQSFETHSWAGFRACAGNAFSLHHGLMLAQSEPRISKWPFFLGDALLLGLAWFVYYQSALPMGPWQLALLIVCVAGGAWLAVLPFLLEYRVTARLAEAQTLATVVAQVQKVESVAAQIAHATGQWQTVQEEAGKTATGAKAIAERMGKEVEAFTQFIQKANDGEKATLRLEVDKLRRAEADWLQVLVRMLDHVYALHSGALRSGQPNLIENVTSFQNACRDAARRVGLTPFQPQPEERFDAQRHKLADGDGAPPPDAVIRATIATGYTFQGRLVRPAVVLVNGQPGEAVAGPQTAFGQNPDGGEEQRENVSDAQSQLPLEKEETQK